MIAAVKKLASEWKLTIDDEFASVHRPLTPEERSLLEADLEQFGCRDNIVAWPHGKKLIVIDGHHRYQICTSLGITFGVTEMEFESRGAAMKWAIDHQRARRNCTADEMAYWRGRRLNEEKQPRGGDRGNQHTKAKAQNEPLAKPSTADRIASEEGVSPATIKRDAAFARAVDTVAANAGHEALAAILTGELGSKKDIERLAELPKVEQKKAVAGGKAAVKEAVKAKPDRQQGFNVDQALEHLRNNVRNIVNRFPPKFRAEAADELRELAKEIELCLNK